MIDEDAILAANAAFYRAFNKADFAEMSRIWADGDVSCIHPGWPALTGRQAVLDSFRNIFNAPERETIEHHENTVMVSGGVSWVLSVEIISGAVLALAATNWFHRIDGKWRMIHHQASPIAATVACSLSSERLN
jgi:ketosteroid isomerase-like protein